MRHDPPHQRVRRGYPLIAAAAVVALAIFNLDTADLFRDHVEVIAFVSGTSGVRPGSPVVAGGVEVGRVLDVGVATTPDAVGLRLRLDPDATPLVRRGSRARTIRRRFIGQPVVRLSHGPADAPALTDEADELRAVLARGGLPEAGPELTARLGTLRERVAGLGGAAADLEGYAGDGALRQEAARLGSRARRAGARLEALEDRVRYAEGLGFALRMFAP